MPLPQYGPIPGPDQPAPSYQTQEQIGDSASLSVSPFLQAGSPLTDTLEDVIRGAIRMVVRNRYLIDYADDLEDELIHTIVTELDGV